MPDADRRLLDRFARGDQDAFETLFRRFEREVYRWILRIVRDSGTAEDALVDAFWSAYRSRARFDPSRSFGAWMRRIATNAALHHLRRIRRTAALSAIRPSAEGVRNGHEGLHQSIELAFRRLPPRLQAVAALALIEQQPYAEIADALGLPIGTVKSRVFRATRALREELVRLGVRV